MKYSQVFLVIIFAFADFSICLADTPIPPPEEIPIESFYYSDSAKKRIAINFNMGDFKGEFEETTLEAVQKAVGTGDIYHHGDAASSTYWLCYTVSNQNLSQRIWITSGEMGGGTRVIGTTAKLVPLGTQSVPSCPDLPANMQEFSIDQGIRLGLQYSDLVKKLGAPTERNGDWLLYNHSRNLKNDFEENGSIFIRLEDNKVVFLDAGKITSN